MVNKINLKNLIIDQDLLKISTLLYFDHKLETIEKNKNSNVSFGVIRQSNTDQVLEKFYKNELKVEPNKFNYIMRDLKRKVFQV
jgi:hypothetical protein